MATNEITIKDFQGRILGYIKEDSNGNRIATNFYFKILGRYNKADDTTRDFMGRIIARGDILAALIKENNNNLNV